MCYVFENWELQWSSLPKGFICWRSFLYCTEEKFDDIFNFISDSDILYDIEYKSRLAAALGEQLKMRVTNHCRRIKPHWGLKSSPKLKDIFLATQSKKKALFKIKKIYEKL